MAAFHTALLTSLLVAAAPAMVQDVGFRVLNPAAHAQLASALPSRSDDERTLSRAKSTAHRLLTRAGIAGEVSGRIKTLLSTHHKMERKGLGADEVADRIALRVLVDTVDEAYTVYEALHDTYAPVAGEQDDYIANPKANGYRSLHTAVYVGGRVVEYQVRTHEMHADAESGAAAHWRYKLA